jgi:hypothetical protein
VFLNCGTVLAPAAFQSWQRGLRTPCPSPQGEGHVIFQKGKPMSIEKFEDPHERWRTLWLVIAGVVAITLTWNVLMLSLKGISY